jgi:hypothetical protein
VKVPTKVLVHLGNPNSSLIPHINGIKKPILSLFFNKKKMVPILFPILKIKFSFGLIIINPDGTSG